MRYSTAIFVFLVSNLAKTALAVPSESGSDVVLLARQATDVSEDISFDNSTIANATELADTDSSTDTTDSSDVLGGLLSGLTGTVGDEVDGVTGALGSVADGVTGTNAVGDLLGSVTGTTNGIVNNAAGAAGSVVDGTTDVVGLSRNARRALFRRRLDARHFDIEELA